jgi:hypothetical protein
MFINKTRPKKHPGQDTAKSSLGRCGNRCLKASYTQHTQRDIRPFARHLRSWLLITPCNFTLQNIICYVVVLCADMSGNDPTRVEWRSASWCSENMNTVKFQQAIVRRTGLTSEGRVRDNQSARNPTRCFYARWRGRWMRLAAQ